MKSILITCFGRGGIKAHHSLRPWHIGNFLSTQDYDIEFAGTGTYLNELVKSSYPLHNIPDLDMSRLSHSIKEIGMAQYSYELLEKMVTSEIELFNKINPAIIISDYRRSTSISARYCSIPLITINNSSWTKYSKISNWSITKAKAQNLIDPFNKLRNKLSLKNIQSIDDELTGDYCFWADIPKFSPVRNKKPKDQYIGPIIWEDSIQNNPFLEIFEQQKTKSILTLDFGVHASGKLANTIRRELITSGLIIVEVLHSNERYEQKIKKIDKNYIAVDFCIADKAIALSSGLISDGNLETVYRAIKHRIPIFGVFLGGEEAIYLKQINEMNLGDIFYSNNINQLIPKIKFIINSRMQNNYQILKIKQNQFNLISQTIQDIIKT